MLEQLTSRQRKAFAGGLLLALGYAVGEIDVDDPQREAKPATTGMGSAPGEPIDTAEYHRTMLAARAGRPDITDLLTAEVAPGAFVDTEVNVPRGGRPQEVELVGPAMGRFDIACEGCGLSFVDQDDGTTIRLRARNVSAQAVRLVALLRFQL